MTPPLLPLIRTIHQVWLGPDPLPATYQAYADSWRRHHPDWQYILWTEDDLDAFPLFRRLEHLCDHHAQRADLLRICILAVAGGLYVDTDVECLAPWDDLLAQQDFVTVQHRPGMYCNHLLYSAYEGHSIGLLHRVLRTGRFGPAAGRGLLFGPSLLAMTVGAMPYATHLAAHICPVRRDGDDRPLPARARAIHHNAMSWVPDAERPADPLPAAATV